MQSHAKLSTRLSVFGRQSGSSMPSRENAARCLRPTPSTVEKWPPAYTVSDEAVMHARSSIRAH